MLTTAAFLDQIRDETRIVIHLAGKLPKESLAWRPTPGQRSAAELLAYLTTCAVQPVRFVVLGGWGAGAADDVLADFPAAMQRQAAEIATLATPLTPVDMARPVTMPWGQQTTLGAMTFQALKHLVAYRMQLFLYAKSMGVANLGSMNCWAGMDAPAQAAAAH